MLSRCDMPVRGGRSSTPTSGPSRVIRVRAEGRAGSRLFIDEIVDLSRVAAGPSQRTAKLTCRPDKPYDSRRRDASLAPLVVLRSGPPFSCSFAVLERRNTGSSLKPHESLQAVGTTCYKTIINEVTKAHRLQCIVFEQPSGPGLLVAIPRPVRVSRNAAPSCDTRCNGDHQCPCRPSGFLTPHLP